MKLDRYQILNIFNVEKIANDDVGVYTIHFDKFLDKLSLSEYDKNLISIVYKKENINTEREHLKKVAELLDSKIDVFSEDFWELLFFRKHAYSMDYENRKWNEFNESYEDRKQVKHRSAILKELTIDSKTLENFLNKLTYQQDSYIDLWFNLKKKTKDNSLNQETKKYIINYGSLDKNERQKAVMLSFFKEIKELENLYEQNINSENKKFIEDELSKFKEIEKHVLNLFEENQYHEVIYRKNISINENALIYNLNKSFKNIVKVVDVIEKFMISEIYKVKTNYNNKQYIYTIEGYSEDNLKEKEEYIKKLFIHLPSLLLKKEYKHMLSDDFYLNDETKQFFRQYVTSAEMYKNLNEKLPEQKIKEKKIKI